jgi:Rad3-related DNA helicase
MRGLTVAAFTNVDTSMRLRMDQGHDDQYPVVAENISRACALSSGLTIAIFPSYSYIEKTLEHLRERGLSTELAESRGLRKEERENLLLKAALAERGLCLGVQNGILAKGFESGAVKATTAVLVGLQFNPPTMESNQSKIYFQENFGANAGEMVSRILPASQKAIRAVNSLMYSPAGRKLAILMDRRYHDRRNLESLPPFWDVRFISSPEKLTAGSLVKDDGAEGET